MAFIKEFEEDSSCIGLVNSTSLVLIPKKDSVEDIRGPRPVNFLNSNYKIVTKIHASGLGKHITKLFNRTQSSIVPGRYIMDNYIAANMCSHDQKERQKQCIILKLDFENTYDAVK